MAKQYQPTNGTLARQAARTKRMQEEREAAENGPAIIDLLDEQVELDEQIAENRDESVSPGEKGVTQSSQKARRKAQLQADSEKAAKAVAANIGRPFDASGWQTPTGVPGWQPNKA